MSLEKVVVDQVANTLCQDDLAEFYTGTLFVDSINKKEARGVFHTLRKNNTKKLKILARLLR